MPRKPPADDLIVLIGSDSELGRYREVRRDRASQDVSCDCPAAAYARKGAGCKHARPFETGRGAPAVVALALALEGALAARRASPKNTAVSLTATITVSLDPQQPVRAIVLPT